jgi:two-component system response regulator AtoC
VVQRAVEKQMLRRRAELLEPFIYPEPIPIIAESQAMKAILEKIRQLKGQTHLNVLILGESGTGKEAVARLLHQQEGDPKRPFVVVNTPALPTSLIEAELFGVEKGAYTDAKQSRPGKFELADGGDIFLDEIGDLPHGTQAKILRAIQEGTIQRLGSNKTQKIAFRVISATNRPLAELKDSGTFREDLLFRLNDMVLWLPPLRERREDIPMLARHFLQKYTKKFPVPQLGDAAIKMLMEYEWPGNVRELQSTIKRTLVFNKEPIIESVDLSDPLRSAHGPGVGFVPTPQGSYSDQIAQYERHLLEVTLKKHHGNKRAAMTELHLPRATFYRKMHDLRVRTS